MSRGDVIEVDLPSGRLAYIQDLGQGRGGRLARFLPGKFEIPLRGEQLRSLVRGKSLYSAHCLIEFLLVEEGARIVANLPVPDGEGSIPAMVTMGAPKDWRRWWVTDEDGVRMPAPEYLRSHPGVEITEIVRSDDAPGPKELRARIEAGWTPSNQVEVHFDHAPMPLSERFREVTDPRTEYFMYFRTKEAAVAFVESVGDPSLELDVADHDQDGLWEVTVAHDGYLNRALAKQLEVATKKFDGIYDGPVDMST
jgi:hypothetical protein